MRKSPQEKPEEYSSSGHLALTGAIVSLPKIGVRELIRTLLPT
jgi:hypothetical protein